MLRLHIANKRYSSWSQRPWLAMRVKEIAFEEVMHPFDVPNGNPEFWTFSPSGKVPVLDADGVVIWDSMAILEYVAEQFPSAALWPEVTSDRARARAVSHEMHSGFMALRDECPFNLGRAPGAIPLSDRAAKDRDRIEAIWQDSLDNSAGPFLFGEFSVADAMYAPIVARIRAYAIPISATSEAYCRTIESLPAWDEWLRAALQETWICENVEI